MGNAIVWFRRDLRLADNPALQAALRAGHAPIPVYIHAPDEDVPWQPGAASLTWLHRSLTSLSADLRTRGSRLIVRRGSSLQELQQIIGQLDVDAVYWNRLYEPAAIARDSLVKATLKATGVHAESSNGALLVEPWTVATQSGDPYRVFTPFWRTASQQVAGQKATTAPRELPGVPVSLLGSEIASLQLVPRPSWDRGFWTEWQPGEAGAARLLDTFLGGAARGYKEARDFPDRIGSSRLSPHLHFGEISPRRIAERVLGENSPAIAPVDVAHYISELGWREFAHHLLFHYPHTPHENLTPRFDRFDWAMADPSMLKRWQQGRTGVPLVDAGMRELWHTGWMHNRVRMVVASYLTKNMRYHWIDGARWFWDTLVDADLANNTQGWQWSAGTGADAAPYFRILSPVAQAERFDGQGHYIRKWVSELAALPTPALFAPWQHPDLLRKLAPEYPPQPMIDLAASRAAALDSYKRSK